MTGTRGMTGHANVPAGTPLVEPDHVGKSHGNVRALEGVSLEVHAGEISCVLGDNGAGKTTLIQIAAGPHRPDAATVRIEGEEVGCRWAGPRRAGRCPCAAVPHGWSGAWTPRPCAGGGPCPSSVRSRGRSCAGRASAGPRRGPDGRWRCRGPERRAGRRGSAHLVGDRFVLLERGRTSGSRTRRDITLDELTRQMAGGSELDGLRHELERA